MYNPYNLEANPLLVQFLQNFKRFLVTEKVAPITQRSYLSDVRSLLKWLYPFLLSNHQIEANLDISLAVKKINPGILSAYETFLQNNEIPLKSINRKFSALRKLGSFCLCQNLILENVFESLKNITEHLPFPEKTYHLGEFTAELARQKASKITIKNYLSDVRQFLTWMNKFEARNLNLI